MLKTHKSSNTNSFCGRNTYLSAHKDTHIVPALKRFGLVKCDCMYCVHTAKVRDYNIERHCEGANERWLCRADGVCMCACFFKTVTSRVVVQVCYFSSSSEHPPLLPLSRSLCRWMARQMRQRTPPLRERWIIHSSRMLYLMDKR